MGIIILTPKAYLALHAPLRFESFDKSRQLEQILDAKRGAAGRDGHEHVRIAGIGPFQRERELAAIVVKDEDPTFGPAAAYAAKDKASTAQRMERMDDGHGSVVITPFRRSRQRRRMPWPRR